MSNVSKEWEERTPSVESVAALEEWKHRDRVKASSMSSSPLHQQERVGIISRLKSAD